MLVLVQHVNWLGGRSVGGGKEGDERASDSIPAALQGSGEKRQVMRVAGGLGRIILGLQRPGPEQPKRERQHGNDVAHGLSACSSGWLFHAAVGGRRQDAMRA